MRDILIHQYFGVDVQIVWDTIKKSLPKVKKQLKHIQVEGKKKSKK